MAAGDVDAEIVAANAAAIDTAVTAMRTTANDHWVMCSISGGTQVLIVNVEEA